MTPPTDAEVAEAERGLLAKSIRKVIQKKDLGNASKWLEQLLAEDEELLAEDVAAAAAYLLADRTGIAIDFPSSQDLPKWAQHKEKASSKNRKKGEKVDFNRVNEVEIYLSIGKVAGVRPGDVVGAIANETGIPGDAIGKVSLFDHKCFVGLSKENAEMLFAEHESIEIRGKSILLKKARPRQESERPSYRKPYKKKAGGGGGRPYKGNKSPSSANKKRGDKPFGRKKKGAKFD